MIYRDWEHEHSQRAKAEAVTRDGTAHTLQFNRMKNAFEVAVRLWSEATDKNKRLLTETGIKDDLVCIVSEIAALPKKMP